MAARTAIGLDIGTSGVRAAELSIARGAVTLDRFGQVALPIGAVRDGEVVDAPMVAAAIRQLWSATRFSTKRVILGVANQRVVVRSVELPWLPMEELRRSLPLQVVDMLPTPVDQAVLDFHPLEEVTGSRGRFLRGLLVAASRESVLTNLRCVQAAGLRPAGVDLTGFAVLRAVNLMPIDDPGSEAVVDIGARVTNVVVHRGGVPSFARILLMGGQDITDALAERTGTPLAEAEGIKQALGMVGQGGRLTSSASRDESLPVGRSILVPDVDLAAAVRSVESTAQTFIDEIRGSLDYYNASSPHHPISRVVICGGGSLLRGLADRLGQAVRVPVEEGRALGSLRLGRTGLTEDQLHQVEPLAATPVGLALGGLR